MSAVRVGGNTNPVVSRAEILPSLTRHPVSAATYSCSVGQVNFFLLSALEQFLSHILLLFVPMVSFKRKPKAVADLQLSTSITQPLLSNEDICGCAVYTLPPGVEFSHSKVALKGVVSTRTDEYPNALQRSWRTERLQVRDSILVKLMLQYQRLILCSSLVRRSIALLEVPVQNPKPMVVR